MLGGVAMMEEIEKLKMAVELRNLDVGCLELGCLLGEWI